MEDVREEYKAAQELLEMGFLQLQQYEERVQQLIQRGLNININTNNTNTNNINSNINTNNINSNINTNNINSNTNINTNNTQEHNIETPIEGGGMEEECSGGEETAGEEEVRGEETGSPGGDDKWKETNHAEIRDYVHYLLSTRYQMKQQGIKPNAQGFVNFMSVCRTPPLAHLPPSVVQSILESHKTIFTLCYSFDNNKLQIKVLQPFRSPHAPQDRARPGRPYHGYGTKNWIGFPAPDSVASKLKEYSGLLGRRLRSVHLSLGWCKTNKHFYEQCCLGVPQKFKEICLELRSHFYLTFSKIEVLGKEKNKVVVIYEPTPKRKEEKEKSVGVFKEICEKIWEMWRSAGEDYARKQGGVLKMFKNPEGTLEYGEVKGKLIYEMRAIKVKFHVTMGLGTVNDIWKIESLLYPEMEIPAELSYINPGKSTPFKVPK